MSDNISDISGKVWKMATVLKQGGVAFTDYVSQLTYLLFLKMCDEQEECYGEASAIPAGCAWRDFASLGGPELADKYELVLKTLSEQNGMLGQIYFKARNQINTPANLKRVIDMIDSYSWISLDMDVKGEIYESILEKNASAEKGAGQYFTPRPLIQAIVDVSQPAAGMKIHDPFCGTGGFLLGAYSYLLQKKPNLRELEQLQNGGLTGNDIAPLVVSLCSMNMYLHGIGVNSRSQKDCPIQCKDTLKKPEERAFDMILANPPFGTASNPLDGADGELTDDRFFAASSNTQLNALQHIMAILKPHGKASVVLPDNVLFESGAGEAIRKKLLKDFNLHTILRLPTGLFYAQGVQANVIFFEKCPLDNSDHHTEGVWVYDYRTGIKHTLKKNPLKRSDLDDFVSCYRPGKLDQRKATYSAENLNGRWRYFPYSELISRSDTNLDLRWIKEESDEIDASIPELLAMLRAEQEKQAAALAQLAELLKDIQD